MSTIFPSLSFSSQTVDSNIDAAVQAKATIAQQMRHLSSSGYSATQIASQLGVPKSEVDSVLGLTSTAETSALQAVAAASHLSVKA